MANYMSYGNAEDLFEAIGTKKDNKPTNISWSDYINLSDQEREGNHYIITGAPSDVVYGHIIENSSGTDMTPRTHLQFTGNGVTVTDDSANNATKIEINGGGGGAQDLEDLDDVTITSATAGQVLTKTNDGWTNADLPSSGHTIKDNTGTALTQQPNLQFKDAKVNNDSTNSATTIQNFVDIDWDDWKELGDSDNTYYRVQNAPIVDSELEFDFMTKLWENSSPTASFTTQNINLSSDDYDMLLFVCSYSSSNSSNIPNTVSVKGDDAVLEFFAGSLLFYRTATYVSDTVLNISGATRVTSNTAVSSADDSRVIPLFIYGLKKKVKVSLSSIAANVKATVDYSTEEHVIGKWIDGSTLYEKTVYIGTLPNNTTTAIYHDIQNFEKLIKLEGVVTMGSTSSLEIPFSTSTGICALSATSTQIKITTTANYSAYTGYITFRYTKTQS